MRRWKKFKEGYSTWYELRVGSWTAHVEQSDRSAYSWEIFLGEEDSSSEYGEQRTLSAAKLEAEDMLADLVDSFGEEGPDRDEEES